MAALYVLSSLNYSAQRIVDFMGHASSQATDRHHFFGLDYNFIQPLFIGNIVHENHCTFDFSSDQGINSDIKITDRAITLDRQPFFGRYGGLSFVDCKLYTLNG